MSIQEHLQRIRSDRFLLVWNLSLLATFVLPLLIFTVARSGAAGQDEAGEQQYDQYGNYVGKNHWWQFWRSNGDGNEAQQNGNGEDAGAPWWYLWTDNGDAEDDGNGTLVFVYLWTLVSLVLVGVVGNKMMSQGDYQALRWTLLGFANCAFVTMVLVGGLDAIQTEGREIEETGWYGQTSVLLFLTCGFGLIKSIVFSFLLAKKTNETAEDDKQVELIQGDV